NFEQRNHWSWNANTFVNFPALTSRKTRGGPVMASKEAQSLNLYFDTNGNHPWFWSISYSPNWGQDGSWGQDINPSFRWKPMPALGLQAGPEMFWGHTDSQFASDSTSVVEGTGSRFAELDQTQFSMNLRADYAATPNVSVQLFVQPLVSTLRYHDFKE